MRFYFIYKVSWSCSVSFNSEWYNVNCSLLMSVSFYLLQCQLLLADVCFILSVTKSVVPYWYRFLALFCFILFAGQLFPADASVILYVRVHVCCILYVTKSVVLCSVLFHAVSYKVSCYLLSVCLISSSSCLHVNRAVFMWNNIYILVVTV